MTTSTFPQSKAQWAKGPWSGGIGAVLTIGIHVLAIALLLAVRAPLSEQAAPMNVTVISATPRQAEQLQTPIKPRLDQPKFHIPQPEIALAEDITSNAAPIAVVSAAPSTAAPIAVTQTQPSFDADYLNNPVPSYPPLARRMREEGVVYVRVFVTSEGLPAQIELKRSSGSTRLDEAALVTVKKWRFVPARRGSETVGAWVIVPIAFNLTA